MKATELKKKYLESWMNVYSPMVHDLCECMPRADVQRYEDCDPNCRIVRIAHNAAFLACYEIHNKLKKVTESNIKEIIES